LLYPLILNPLPERLTKKDSPNFLFKNLLEIQPIPLSALSSYIESLWATAYHKSHTREPLELSEKKNMIIESFLEELKTKCYRKVLLEIIKIKEQTRNRQRVDLARLGPELITSSRKIFENEAADFIRMPSYKRLLKELDELVIEDLLETYHTQLNNLLQSFLPNLHKAFNDKAIDCNSY
jgi:hypothetical protein